MLLGKLFVYYAIINLFSYVTQLFEELKKQYELCQKGIKKTL